MKQKYDENTWHSFFFLVWNLQKVVFHTRTQIFLLIEFKVFGILFVVNFRVSKKYTFTRKL